MFYDKDGIEECGDSPDIIHIERIASKPQAKVDKDAAWLLKLETTPGYIRRRLRSIARRPNNGAKP